MTENKELNCIGMKCPRPIIEIAKMARRSPPGTIMKIIADDLAFESDMRAWCDNARATLVSLETENGRSIAVVKLADEGG